MNPQQTAKAREAVDRCLERLEAQEDGTALTRLQGGDWGHFDQLVSCVSSAVAAVGPPPDRFDVAVTTAMCLYGPDNSVPPENMRCALLKIITLDFRDIPEEDRYERILEFVAAFGCGMWRSTKQGQDTWDGIWAGAVGVVSRWILEYKKDADGHLAGHVFGYEEELDRIQDLPRWNEAESGILAMRFVCGTRGTLPLGQRDAIIIEPDGNMTRLYLSKNGVVTEEYAEVPVGASYVFKSNQNTCMEIGPPQERTEAIPEKAMIIISADPDLARPGIVHHVAPIVLRFGELAELKGPASLRIGKKDVRLCSGDCIRITPTCDGNCVAMLIRGQAPCPNRSWKGSKMTFRAHASVEVTGPSGYTVCVAKDYRIELKGDHGQVCVDAVYEKRPELISGQQGLLKGPTHLKILECTCGHRDCELKHQIAGWNPLRKVRGQDGQEVFLKLRSFIASAIKGSGRAGQETTITTYAFTRSLYWSYRTWEPVDQYRLCYVPTLDDHGRKVERYRLVCEAPALLYMCRCTYCGSYFDVPTAAQIGRVNNSLSSQHRLTPQQCRRLAAAPHNNVDKMLLRFCRLLEHRANRCLWCPQCSCHHTRGPTLSQRLTCIWP